jgi:hypothetical protein
MAEFSGCLEIVALTDKGVECSLAGGSAFWLPRSPHVQWDGPPQVGQTIRAVVPNWLAAKHRQLVGDETFEQTKASQKTAYTDASTSTLAQERNTQ